MKYQIMNVCINLYVAQPLVVDRGGTKNKAICTYPSACHLSYRTSPDGRSGTMLLLNLCAWDEECWLPNKLPVF